MDGREWERNTPNHGSGEAITRLALNDKQGLATTPLSSGPAASQYKSAPPPDSIPDNAQISNQVHPVEDNMQTPRSSFPPSSSLAKQPDLSILRQDGIPSASNKNLRQEQPITESGGYFDRTSIDQHVKKASPVTTSANLEISTADDLANTSSVLQDSPGQPLTTWKRTSPRTIKPPTSDPTTNRPPSVPNSFGSSVNRRRDSQDYSLRHPDQTFASLGPRQHPPPPPTRLARTRSSHSPNWSVTSSSNESFTKDFGHNLSGARTVGNTPAQSPGLYSPSPKSPILSSRKRAPDSDDGRPSSQILQASHLQAPIE